MEIDQRLTGQKLEKLKEILQKMGRVVIAYSGGADSAFLVRVAASVLGKENVLAVTAVSESYPDSERHSAEKMARRMSVDHLIIRTDELRNKDFAKNPVNRCFYCKKELFNKMRAIAKSRGFSAIADGSNADDLADLRYGRTAAARYKIRSPLTEAGLRKDEIRTLSKKMGLATWNKPSLACLASRLSYNQPITKEKLERIGLAEDFMRGLGFRQVRVRCHGDRIIRIEVEPEDIGKLLKKELRDKIARKMKELGFVYVTLDLEGYRTGSMNEGLRLHSHGSI